MVRKLGLVVMVEGTFPLHLNHSKHKGMNLNKNKISVIIRSGNP